MVVSSARRKLTYKDFLRIPEDGRRHEILDGVHVVTPAPTLQHQRVLFRLTLVLGTFIQAHQLGEMFFAPTDVVLSANDIVEPDLLFVSAARAAILKEANVQGSPDLAVEILSPSTRRRDLGKKRERYERLGILEYWVLDPVANTATVFRRARPDAPAFQPPVLLAAEADERLTSPLLPGLEVSLREIFEC